MMTLRAWFSLFLLTILALPAQAQETVGTTGLAYLRIGTNAAASAMGDAQVASSRDAFSTYWNPAGLAAAPKNSVAASHRIWILDTRLYDLAARFQAGANGGIGLFVMAADNGDFEERDQPTAEPEGFFGAQFLSIGASYGRRFGPVRAGVTAKYLSERIFEASANGYAFDAGVQAGLLGEKVRLGAAIQNIGKMSKLGNEATPLPRMVRGGLALSPLSILAEEDASTVLDLSVVAEVSHLLEDDRTQFHLGLSAEVVEMVRLRAGYITNDTLRNLTFGGGLHVSTFIFDYAFLPFEDGFGGPGHVLTLLYNW